MEKGLWRFFLTCGAEGKTAIVEREKLEIHRALYASSKTLYSGLGWCQNESSCLTSRRLLSLVTEKWASHQQIKSRVTVGWQSLWDLRWSWRRRRSLLRCPCCRFPVNLASCEWLMTIVGQVHYRRPDPDVRRTRGTTTAWGPMTITTFVPQFARLEISF